MGRKVICLLLAVWVLAGSVSATAAELGTIRVELGQEGKVTLYRVGDFYGDGYRLSNAYGGGTLSFDDLLSQDIAQWLARQAKDGTTKRAEDGIVAFSGLSEGVYLVVHREAEDGFVPFSPFFITIPWDGDQWVLDAKPKITTEIPQTGDIVLLPASGMLLSWIGLVWTLYGKQKSRR